MFLKFLLKSPNLFCLSSISPCNSRIWHSFWLINCFKLVLAIRKSEIIPHDPKQITHNYSSYTPDQESLLIGGLNFALPPKKLLYRDFRTLDSKQDKLVFLFFIYYVQ